MTWELVCQIVVLMWSAALAISFVRYAPGPSDFNKNK